MIYSYWTKKGKFETDDYFDIPLYKLHSPNEKTPAFENIGGHKTWYFEGIEHRLIGPAEILTNGHKLFYLYGKLYDFETWLAKHPNQNETFQTMMKLRYK